MNTKRYINANISPVAGDYFYIAQIPDVTVLMFELESDAVRAARISCLIEEPLSLFRVVGVVLLELCGPLFPFSVKPLCANEARWLSVGETTIVGIADRLQVYCHLQRVAYSDIVEGGS